ncbi:hypothetical protein C3E90_06385 [Clostridium sp. Cult2]|nr:hypothetical protein [Clostridium sp. Cult2]
MLYFLINTLTYLFTHVKWYINRNKPKELFFHLFCKYVKLLSIDQINEEVYFVNNLFLTGKIGVGKSTILKNALKELNLSIGGYVTERIFEGYYRKYIVKSLYDNMEEYIIVRVDSRDNSKEGFMEAFENGVISILDKSLKHRDLIVLDELGCVENDIDIFTSKVFELLNSKKIVFGILKDDYCSFLNDIRSRDDVIIIRITEENRDYILDHIINILESFIHKTNC